MDLFTAVETFTQIITYVMIVAGIPACIRMLRNKDTTGVPYPFFLTGTANAVMAIGYGLMTDNKTLLHINMFATFCNIFYIASFLFTSKSKGQPFIQLLVLVSFLSGTYIYVTKIADPANEMDALGRLMLICSTVMLLTPLLPVRECIREKNNRSIDLTMLVAGFLCCGAWMWYGTLLKDFYIYGPNFAGVGSYICQAVAMVTYSGGVKQRID